MENTITNAIGNAKATPSQRAALLRAVRELLARTIRRDLETSISDYRGRQITEETVQASGHEIKNLEIYELGHRTRILVLQIELGLKDDEGTMAEIFARPRLQLFVGPNGGLTAYDGNRRLTGRDALIRGVQR